MKCEPILLEDYVEGFLDEDEQKKIEDHLQFCKNCQCEYEQLLNEQNILFAQLNIPKITSSKEDAIMHHIYTDTKRKKSWYTLKISVISVAVIILSFTFYYWHRPPIEVTQQVDEPTQLVETNSSEQEEHLDSKQVLNYNEPFLDVSIDKVVENGENIDIHYRVKFKEQYQRDQDNVYKQLLNKYQDIEVANSHKVDEAQDDFFGSVKSNVRFSIRDKEGQLIITTKRIDGEQPMISNFSASGGGTAILGEMIYTTSVPKYTNPATFEVLQMEAFVFDLFETEVDTAHIQPFQFNNATYTIDSLEIKQRTLYIAISTEGEPEMLASDWHLAIDNRLIGYNSASSDYINNRTVYKLQFENFEQIPANLKLVPSTVIIKKQIDPIVFDLH
ncbi:zf-HC2 domain-containing protein [Lysinibacillus irui]|uniref:zf-HC2 domain-containing protein n=1 Tax=Lysinibacillus irui TaxID=2998077 RepID=UPI002AD576A9|nr:zf-HC2 domain-containing protein [Lysinibacillus irui]MEA0562670.1 zf-HC2 domain-containing protein [Lysinibacillus irui]